jgi:hypothetical protein
MTHMQSHAIFFSHFHFEIKFDSWRFKEKKTHKETCRKKRNKHVQIAETNIDLEDNEESLRENVRDVESNDEII